MKLLAIDTAGERCSVALGAGDDVYQDSRVVRRSHNDVLLAMIDGLFAKAGLQPAVLDGVCFNGGPASFTGVRLAAAAAQAIGYATDALVAAIPSSEILAAHAFEQGLPCVVTSTRSRAVLYYLALYDRHGGCLQADTLVDAAPAWWASGLGVAGDVPPWLESSAPVAIDVQPAVTLLHLGRTRWRNGGFGSPEQALPIYVRGDDPWRG